jgi:hypothetical protein
LPALVELLGSSDPAVQQATATALWAVAHELPDGKLLVGATKGAVPRLAALLSSSSSSSSSSSMAVQQAAAEALESLVAEPVNQGRIREVPGVIASLTGLLAMKCAGVQQAAVAVLRGIGAQVPYYEVSPGAGSHHDAGVQVQGCSNRMSCKVYVTGLDGIANVLLRCYLPSMCQGNHHPAHVNQRKAAPFFSIHEQVDT